MSALFGSSSPQPDAQHAWMHHGCAAVPSRPCKGLLLQVQGFLSGLRRLLPQLQALADILPAPTLDWKLDLLLEGCKYGPMRCLKPRISSGIVPDAWRYLGQSGSGVVGLRRGRLAAFWSHGMGVGFVRVWHV